MENEDEVDARRLIGVRGKSIFEEIRMEIGRVEMGFEVDGSREMSSIKVVEDDGMGESCREGGSESPRGRSGVLSMTISMSSSLSAG